METQETFLTTVDEVVEFGKSSPAGAYSGWTDTFHYFAPKTAQVVRASVGCGQFMDHGIGAELTTEVPPPAEGEGKKLKVRNLHPAIQAAFGVRSFVPKGIVMLNPNGYSKPSRIVAGGNYMEPRMMSDPYYHTVLLVPNTFFMGYYSPNQKEYGEGSMHSEWGVFAIINDGKGATQVVETTYLKLEDLEVWLTSRGLRRVHKYDQWADWDLERTARKAGIDTEDYGVFGTWIAQFLGEKESYFAPREN